MSYGIEYKNFLLDPERVDIYLVELSPYDFDTAATVTLYYSTDLYTSAATDTPASQVYSARATVALNVEQGIVQPGTVVDAAPISGGEVRIAHMFGSDDVLASYGWDGRVARILHVGYSPRADQWVSRADAGVAYKGEVAAVKVGTEEVVIELREVGARLQSQIQTAGLVGLPWMPYHNGTSTTMKTLGPEPKLTALEDAITVEFRIYLDDTTPAAVTRIVGLHGTTFPWQIQLSTTGQIIFRSSATVYHTSTFTLTAGKWYHVAVTADATSVISYLYDIAADTVTVNTTAGNATGRASASADVEFGIGARTTDFLSGYVNNVRVWSPKLTAAEIAERRFRRLTAGEEADADLVGLWRLDEGTGDEAADSSAIVTTQTTISAVAAGNKFTRATGSFITDGWVAGMTGHSSGFGALGNNGNAWVVGAGIDATNLPVTGITLTNESSVVTALLQSGNLVLTDATWVPALEGQADAAGTLLPLAYGRVESAPGILVSQAPACIYLFALNGSEITEVFVGGLGHSDPDGDPIGHDLDTAYTDLTTFLLATTPGGMYDTLIYGGGAYVRLGSAPSFPMTIDGKGDAGEDPYDSNENGYVETAADIVRRIVLTRGVDPLAGTELDLTSFSTLNTANSAPVGVYCFGDEPVADVLAFVLGSVGAAGYFARSTGKFSVIRFGGVTGSPTVSFDERHVISVEPERVDLPIYAVTLGYRRQYTQLQLDEIAGTVVQADDEIVARLMTEYLTAHVEDQDVLDRHPRAGVYIVNTGLATESDAMTEAQRVLALFGGAGRGYRIKVPDSAAVTAVEGVIVEFTLSEFDQDGEPLARLGLVANDASSQFIVLRVVPINDEESVPAVELVLWKGGE